MVRMRNWTMRRRTRERRGRCMFCFSPLSSFHTTSPSPPAGLKHSGKPWPEVFPSIARLPSRSPGLPHNNKQKNSSLEDESEGSQDEGEEMGIDPEDAVEPFLHLFGGELKKKGERFGVWMGFLCLWLAGLGGGRGWRRSLWVRGGMVWFGLCLWIDF